MSAAFLGHVRFSKHPHHLPPPVPYVNFMTEEESGRVAAAYGANYDRLVRIKNQYDPDNLFHLNQNIKPSPRQATSLVRGGNL